LLRGFGMRAAYVLAGVMFANPAFAYDAAPAHSFTKPTVGGKYVLVMLLPHERPAEKGLKEKYGRSGLYPLADPTKPAWNCEWTAEWDRNVFASDDGAFAVRIPDGEPGLRHWLLMSERPVPPRPAGWEDAPALFIYQNGKPFRTLALKDVFDTSQFTDRDCFMGPVVTIDSFQDSGGRVIISAEADGRKQTATVAFRTGEVVERGRAPGVIERNLGGSLRSGPLDGEEAAAGCENWLRVTLIGLGVVALGCAAAAVVSVLLVWRRRARTG
jgi:hypothetical protein